MVNLKDTPNLETRTFAVYLGHGDAKRLLGYFPVKLADLPRGPFGAPRETPKFWAQRQAALQAGYTEEQFLNCWMPPLTAEEVLMPHLIAWEKEIARIKSLVADIRSVEMERIRVLVRAFESQWDVSMSTPTDWDVSKLQIGSLAWDDDQGDAVGALWDPGEKCFVLELEIHSGKRVEIVPPFPVEAWTTLLEQISQGQWTLTFEGEAFV